MDYLGNAQHRSMVGYVEGSLSIGQCEEDVQHFLFGSDVEENLRLEEGNAQIREEAPNDTSHCQDSNEQSRKGNDLEGTACVLPQEEGESDGVPRVGMKFSNEGEAYNFYNAYAARVGFSVRKGDKRHNSKGVIRQRNFMCSKEGLRVDYELSGAQKENKLETRTDCKACIRLIVTDGVWEVSYFNPDHNHELAAPEQRKYLRSARKLFENSLNRSLPSPVDHNEVGIVRVPTVPTIGMKVFSESEAYDLYNLYATHIGFSIRKGDYRYNSRGQIRHRIFVCSKQGLRVDDEPDRVRKKNRTETRTDCKASIRFTITDGVWEVTYFNRDHNHEFVEPEQRKNLRSGRRMVPSYRSFLTSMSKPDEVGNPNNVRLKMLRLYMIEAGDSQSVINRFKHRLIEDALFFYSVQVDSSNRLANFFWRDGRSRLDFDCFGDVVVLDTSFKDNKYNLVCAPFWGVNHHGKSVVFGCAILSDESLSSFIWLFETFLESMGNRQPKTIFTNQCQELDNAIEKVLPKTSHRLCIWNIQENATQNLSDIYSNPEFKSKFDMCLNGCRTEMEFQSSWSDLIKGLEENEWLKRLHDLRVKWCPIFSAYIFSANVQSNQRSDKVRTIFNEVSCKTMNLTQFVHHYEETIKRLRLEELEDDLHCNQDLPTRASRNSAMLKQAADVYTIELFKLFQEEMIESLSIIMNEISSDGRLHTYELVEEENSGGYIVEFDANNCTATCSCKMFECMGLLCRHALRVLNMKNVTKLPAQYILKRWTKGARKGIIMPENGEPSSMEPTQSLLRSRLMHKAFCAIEKSLMTTKGSDIADTLLDQIVDQSEKEIAVLRFEDIDNGGSDPIHVDAINDSNDMPCSMDSSHTKSKSQLHKKRRRKASKPNIFPGQEEQQFLNPSGIIFHPQFPTFFRPPFHPAAVGMSAGPYAFQQGQIPPWVLGNIRPAHVLQGTDQLPHAHLKSHAHTVHKAN